MICEDCKILPFKEVDICEECGSCWHLCECDYVSEEGYSKKLPVDINQSKFYIHENKQVGGL